jgi:hypothetical protein
MDGQEYWIDDLAKAPFKVSDAALADARARIGSYKNRLLIVEQLPDEVDLRRAVIQGLEDCVNHLSSNSDSFSLPTIRKWGKTIMDSKNKKGWLKVFEDRRGLYSTLRSIFESLESTCGGLRGLYADFLVEAADVVDKPELVRVAEKYRALGQQWLQLAEAVLPDEVEAFKETKALIRERNQVLLQGGEAWRGTQKLMQELREISTRCNLEFPLDDQGIMRLFTEMQEQLLSIYQGELQVLAALKSALA